MDRETLEPLLQELSEMLRRASPQAIDLLQKISQAIGEKYGEELADLCSKVDAFEFEEASAALQLLITKLIFGDVVDSP